MLTDAPVANAGGQDGLIQDTTTATFRQDVIAESMNQPVLVDFWAPWCGPCKQLTPTLERVVQSAKGAVKLVKMNIDEHPSIPGQLGIQSIPAVIAFDRGRPVDGFMGAVPESEVRTFIDRIAGPAVDPIDEALAEADRLTQAGQLEEAMQLYAEVLREQPENLKALAALAKMQLDAGQPANARQVLDMVPDDKRDDPILAGVRAALELAEQAETIGGDLAGLEQQVARDPDDHQASFDLALALNGLGRRDEAVDHLVNIARRDRTWNDDGARKQLLQFFEAWGLMDPAAIRGRRQLSTLLFS